MLEIDNNGKILKSITYVKKLKIKESQENLGAKPTSKIFESKG